MTSRHAYDRLLDVALALSEAGRVGVTTPGLISRVGYHNDDAGKRALMRDLDDLRAVGLEIDNAADPGEDARYVLRPGDVRLRVEFTPAQRTALTAALMAARETVSADQTPLPVDLDRVREAVRAGCLLHFRYNGIKRDVDPYSYQWVRGDVLLVGRDRAAETVKSFSVRRMLDLGIDAPGTARIPANASRPGLDPATWLIDPAVEAQLYCPGFAEDVLTLMGGTADGDVVRVTVTNRLIFFARLLELGSRARLDAPEELRAQLRGMLEAAL
jgi:predicted DNA-binding transcriptional regulator YafY